MENTVLWLITGSACGLISLAMDKGKQQSAVSTMALGAVGGFVGGWLLTAFEVFNLAGIEGGLVRATLGAAVVLLIAKLFE
jgi:uncharacterized membrane protein YeaQ/YmgE (transglycosylase-associated protein family)